MTKYEFESMQCPHKTGDAVKPVEWDHDQNHVLSCGCVASPGKLGETEVETWVVNDHNCEYKEA